MFFWDSYCSDCHLAFDDRLCAEFEKVGESFKTDGSEFNEMFEKPYDELKKYYCTKYSRIRKFLKKVSYHANNKEGIIVKCDLKSIALRRKGNESFAKGELLNSLKFYCKSMAFAKSDENRALCYGNLSAIFLKIEMLFNRD